MAEIIPFEPDPGNAGVGSGGANTIMRAISFVRQKGMAFLVRRKLCKCSVAELASRTIPEAERSGIRHDKERATQRASR